MGIFFISVYFFFFLIKSSRVILPSLIVGAQLHPTLRGAGRGRGRLVPDGDGSHRVASEQSVLQPSSPAPLLAL